MVTYNPGNSSGLRHFQGSINRRLRQLHDSTSRLEYERSRRSIISSVHTAAAPETHPGHHFLVFVMISLIISLPSLTASGNLGAKYCCIFSNRFRYASNAPNDTHSDHACSIMLACATTLQVLAGGFTKVHYGHG